MEPKVTVILDFTKCRYLQEVYDEMSKQMEWEEGYGENLDALFDCLTEVYNKTIIIKNSQEVDEDLLATFKDAAEENPDLKLILD